MITACGTIPGFVPSFRPTESSLGRVESNGSRSAAVADIVLRMEVDGGVKSYCGLREDPLFVAVDSFGRINVARSKLVQDKRQAQRSK